MISADRESVDEFILPGRCFVVAQLSRSLPAVDLLELSADDRGIVELLLGLGANMFRGGNRPAQGSEWKTEKA